MNAPFRVGARAFAPYPGRRPTGSSVMARVLSQERKATLRRPTESTSVVNGPLHYAARTAIRPIQHCVQRPESTETSSAGMRCDTRGVKSSFAPAKERERVSTFQIGSTRTTVLSRADRRPPTKRPRKAILQTPSIAAGEGSRPCEPSGEVRFLSRSERHGDGTDDEAGRLH